MTLPIGENDLRPRAAGFVRHLPFAPDSAITHLTAARGTLPRSQHFAALGHGIQTLTNGIAQQAGLCRGCKMRLQQQEDTWGAGMRAA